MKDSAKLPRKYAAREFPIVADVVILRRAQSPTVCHALKRA